MIQRLLARAVVSFIRLYQGLLSGVFGGNCRFHPSCSEYAILAIERRGPIVGTGKSLLRIARCGPWSKGGVDYPNQADRLGGANG